MEDINPLLLNIEIDIPEYDVDFEIEYGDSEYDTKFLKIVYDNNVVGMLEYLEMENNLMLFALEIYDEYRGIKMGTNAIKLVIDTFKPQKLIANNANENHLPFWDQFGEILSETPFMVDGEQEGVTLEILPK